jgi:hypothetical protein
MTFTIQAYVNTLCKAHAMMQYLDSIFLDCVLYATLQTEGIYIYIYIYIYQSRSKTLERRKLMGARETKKMKKKEDMD